MELVRPKTGSRLHLPVCPYLRHDTEYRTALAADLDEVAVCDWCRKELVSAARVPYRSLDDAMKAFGSRLETMSLIRRTMRGIAYNAVWMPKSGTYIGLAQDGVTVAWVQKSAMGFADGHWITLAGPPEQRSLTVLAGIERRGDVCPKCFTEMPVAGKCAHCY